MQNVSTPFVDFPVANFIWQASSAISLSLDGTRLCNRRAFYKIALLTAEPRQWDNPPTQPQYFDIFANGDGQYLYPCEGGAPCGSVRLSGLRDGLEDWELFSRVEAGAGVALLQQMVRGPRDWEFAGHSLMESLRAQAAAAVGVEA